MPDFACGDSALSLRLESATIRTNRFMSGQVRGGGTRAPHAESKASAGLHAVAGALTQYARRKGVRNTWTERQSRKNPYLVYWIEASVYHPRHRGSYREMGFHYGDLLYRHGFRLPPQSPTAVKFGRQSETEVRRVFPQILEEIRGFAEACRSSYDELLSFVLMIGVEEKSFKCSIFATVDDRHVIFGRNYDFFYKYKDYTESSLTVPDGGYSSIGHSDVFIGKEDGVNEKMLAIGMTFVGPVLVRPGINFPIVVRYVLDRCSNVKQAIQSLRKIRYSTTNNYLLADASGDLAVVEASPRMVNIRTPSADSGYIACTNHFVTKKMLEMEDLSLRSSDSLRRYYSIGKGIRQVNGRLGHKQAEKILSDNLGGVCSHRSDLRMGTLWSFIADLREQRVTTAEGHPCRTEYREDLRLRRLAA